MTGASGRKPIGLLGGVFDPVHIAHIDMARACRDALDLQEVRLIPANEPPHKSGAAAGRRHRFAMLERAVAEQPRLAVSDMEFARGGVSYTIDTLSALRAQDPRQPLCFIMGTDAFESLPSWRRWQALTDHAHLVLVPRRSKTRPPDATLRGWREARACSSLAALRNQPGGCIYQTELAVPDISSSRIRELLATGADARQWLPAGVHRYIMENKLYA